MIVVAQRYFFYCEHLIWLALDLLPPLFRTAIFKLMFKRFGKGASIDYRSYIRYSWKVTIGERTAINRGCCFYASLGVKNAEIVIGDHVAFGPGVTLCSASHNHEKIELPDTGATIRIGDHAWLGANSIILPGVEIGKGAVIGAGSVVTKDVSPWTIVGGNPAKKIGERYIR